MTALSNVLSNLITKMPTELQQELYGGRGLPKRYFIQAPEESNTFILPMKQSFMKDARLMPGTRCMLALLSGWLGTGQKLELTQSTIAKHLGRSVRQVYNYLKDATRLGYLTYNYRKNRLGMITGIRIWLSLDLLRPKKQKPRENRRNQARQSTTTIKDNLYINNKDQELEDRLARLGHMICQSTVLE